MASIPLVNKTDYVRVDAQYVDQIEIAGTYANHRKFFDLFDFATPLFALMYQARKKIALSDSEKKVWVLAAYRKMVEMAYETDPNKSQIALASASSLLEAIYTISTQSSLFLRDPMTFYRYPFSDVGAFTDHLIQNHSDSLMGKDLIPALEVIYWMKLHYMRDHTLKELGNAFLKKLEGTDEEMTLYVKLVPIIFTAFETIAGSYISLSPIRRPEKKGFGCCCLCQ